MTYIDALASSPAAPPPLDDNGSVLWPPECHYARWPEEFPFVAEVWEKYLDPSERRRIMEFRYTIQCRTCGTTLVAASTGEQETVARRHQREHHARPLDKRGPHAQRGYGGRYSALSFDLVHPLWTWQLMGFEDLWYGKPTGWRTVLDGRTVTTRAWEFDAVELGSAVADALAEGTTR